MVWTLIADAAAGPGRRPESEAGTRNLMQLVQLRWLAVAGQLATILVVRHGLSVPLPLAQMLGLLGVLVVINVASWLRARMAVPVAVGELFGALLVDVAVLTGLLYFAGGITNPFIYLYLLQVAVAAVLLPRPFLWAMVVLTSCAFVALTQWYRPLALPNLDVAFPPLYIAAVVICFVLSAALLVIYSGRISAILRRRDAGLADLRQRAAEEEHIVRMGLLASGAAHELGTPLATLSVILGDWSRMAPFAGEPELREDIEEMQRQVQRCKLIVAGILQSAGEARGQAPVHTTLHAFLDGVAERWRGTRPAQDFRYDRAGVPNLAMVSDAALQQMIDNVLDNAADAAPDAPIELRALCEEDTLVLKVLDRGPGFPPAMLERLGKPYQSTKGRPGRGMGLFLCVNVARMLGGQVSAGNRHGGGAEVIIRLPLAGIVETDR
jgi:two-component system sensor histidine kinase RegB